MTSNANTASRPVLVGITPDLPDDPRDCCRAAHAIMGDDFHDAEELVRDMLSLTFAAIPDLFPDDTPAVEQLRRCLNRAEHAMARLSVDLDQVQALIRHGRTDLRRQDAILAARSRACDEGSDPDAAAEEARRAYDAQQEGAA